MNLLRPVEPAASLPQQGTSPEVQSAPWPALLPLSPTIQPDLLPEVMPVFLPTPTASIQSAPLLLDPTVQPAPGQGTTPAQLLPQQVLQLTLQPTGNTRYQPVGYSIIQLTLQQVPQPRIPQDYPGIYPGSVLLESVM